MNKKSKQMTALSSGGDDKGIISHIKFSVNGSRSY